MNVVTRFAPSPTGMLHIGGARTALFNALLARRYKGKFLLRIEDTDKARSTSKNTQAILDGLAWLGLASDQATIFQSKNAARHIECAHKMVATGKAFRCYATPEALQDRRRKGEEKRAAAKVEGISEAKKAALLYEAETLMSPYRSAWRDGQPAPSAGTAYTIRLRAPDAGKITIDDHVQGKVTLDAKEIDDLILLRSDGSPTYMLAVVVDDHDMGVTHILRGDDHFRNTFRQIPIYQAMGWQLPVYAHVPMIHGDDGKKLSKRHGALSTLAYRDMGYLPEAVNAYLLRLGWSHGDKEIFTMDEAAQVFNLAGLNKSPAQLDLAKLGDVNSHFIQSASTDHLLCLLKPELLRLTELTESLLKRLSAALPTLKQRGNTLPELAEACRFLWDSHANTLSKSARKALREDKLVVLAKLRKTLDQSETWTIEALQAALDSHCTQHALSIGQVGPPLRAALTGGLPAPDLALVMSWLGRHEVIARIDKHLPA